ncbi:3'-5' exonuclease [Aliiglaciecola sp. LCG003]|uniref:3'-5' exonuclease n=1 Tax=Aliiglaciecola sp. LCG003 TaxID=3053655 RepID=UPI0025737C41|nr:3'-5' exonuclease [Aliiglaciecola sp. LCG003]WJG08823.1 3'-5' exonuclease [Aliiglaciecola sp. LCG003]
MWQSLINWWTPSLALPEKFRTQPWGQIPFLAVDLELTSLDAEQSNILSIGWVQGKASLIPLETCYYKVITTTASLHQSPIIHGLVGQDIEDGEPVRVALEHLLDYAQSHVWVFHCTNLDMSVLTKVYHKLGISLPQLVTVDTLRLALYQLNKAHQIPAPNAATLTSCRQRHNLPLAPAHNALDDALATMELLYAQLRQFDPLGRESFASLMSTGAVKVFQHKPI